MSDVSAQMSNVSTLELLMHAVFAALGGIVRELKNPDKKQDLVRFIAGAFIGIFVGLVVYFICKQYNTGEYITVAMTGLGGYVGTPMLDFIAWMMKKAATLRFGKSMEEEKGE